MFIAVPAGSTEDLSATGSWKASFDKYFLPGMSYKNTLVYPKGVISILLAIINAMNGAFAGQLIPRGNQLVERKGSL